MVSQLEFGLGRRRKRSELRGLWPGVDQSPKGGRWKVYSKEGVGLAWGGPTKHEQFKILCNFLADTLEEVCTNDTSTRVMVNEVFENDTHLFYSSEVGEGRFLGVKKNRSNFTSQFYVSSMGVVIANFLDVSN